MADKKGAKKEEAAGYNRAAHYKIEGTKVVRARRDCPKCGPGRFLAQHKDRLACGNCGYTEKVAAPAGGAPPAGDKGAKKGGGKPKPAQAPAQ